MYLKGTVNILILLKNEIKHYIFFQIEGVLKVMIFVYKTCDADDRFREF